MFGSFAAYKCAARHLTALSHTLNDRSYFLRLILAACYVIKEK